MFRAILEIVPGNSVFFIWDGDLNLGFAWTRCLEKGPNIFSQHGGLMVIYHGTKPKRDLEQQQIGDLNAMV